MTPLVILLSFLLGVVGAVLLYVASPQQQLLRRRHGPGRAYGWGGAGCALASLGLLWPYMGSAAAVASWLTLLMLVWSAAPFFAAWWQRRRRAA